MNSSLPRTFLSACAMLALLAMLCGVMYPLGLTAVAHMLFPGQAGGSLVYRDTVCVGSALLAQPSDAPGYFSPRPSAAGWDALPSGGSNLGPVSGTLRDSIRQRREYWRRAVPGSRAEDIPADLLTASASGLDPHISSDAAHFQVPSIAAARRFSSLETQRLHALIDSLAEATALLAPGRARVNVLALNIALDHARRGKGS